MPIVNYWTLTYDFELDSDNEADAMQYVKDHFDEPTDMLHETEGD